MQGLTTDYVTLIRRDLRERLSGGFTILKELVQNADDAKARTLIFGLHGGFSRARHPLLMGPGLWFFNDGEFKESDATALRSFGINSKAGDASTIGKFGLGMKSVFHLCEALFYVACDGTVLHHEGLTPWRQDGPWPHPEWDETDDADWNYLTDLGKALAKEKSTWFLLWLPLRMRKHLCMPLGQESAPIIADFPGDDTSSDALRFLRQPTLANDVAEMLPLLQHLEGIEHQGESNCFALRLDGARGSMGNPQFEGQIRFDDGQLPLVFSGRRLESSDANGWFANMRKREEWPRPRYRDELGRERQRKDQTSPEAAVLFCAGHGDITRSRLQWAVFLPLDDGGENLSAGHGNRQHSLILHGQFFVDTGRKGVDARECLDQEPEDLGDAPNETLLRKVWNQRLAQDVMLPLVLPALECYAEQQELSDDECNALTRALSGSRWFKTFSTHVCRNAVWMRTLQLGTEPRWRLIAGESRSRLRPVPAPPRSAPHRPWNVFPKLAACNVTPYDAGAPRLGSAPTRWQQEELEILLSRADGLFVGTPAMDYMAEFLELSAGHCLSTENLQRLLIGALRNGLRTAEPRERRQVAKKARRLIQFVEPERRLALSFELPDSVLKSLWEIDSPTLLVPRDLEPEPLGCAKPQGQALAAWLQVLDRALDSNDGKSAQDPILAVMQGLLQTLPPEARGHFLRTNPELRVFGVRDARSDLEKPVSFQYLDRVRAAGTLFRFAVGRPDTRIGIAPLLARAIPDAEVCLVRAEAYRALFPNDETGGHVADQNIPTASDGQACLAAVGRQSTGRVGSVAARRELLKRANDPGADRNARRGLRLLLHGSLGHRTDDAAKLWIGRRVQVQHPAWNRLWAALHKGDHWSQIPDELADTIPRGRWSDADISEIDARSLVDELHRTDRGVEAPHEFSIEERDEILSRIEDEDLWRRLPLHTAVGGDPVSADHDRVYLAPPDCDDPVTRDATLIAHSSNPLVGRQQEHWLRPLDDRARIQIALGSREPSLHWRGIMDALETTHEDAIDDDLRRVLRSRAWLPTCSEPVKPEDVIDVQGSLEDEAHRLVAEHRTAHGPCFAVPADLDAAVRDHQAWRRLRQVAFSSAAEGIERLGLLLEELPTYHVGEWPGDPDPEAVKLLARCDLLPGWRLLEIAAIEPFNLDTAWDKLGSALSKRLAPRRLADILNWLSGHDDRWKLRKSAHDIYLRQLVGYGQAAGDHLPRLRLASSEDGRWREADELCSGAHGVVRDRLLDPEQADILGNLVCPAGSGATDDQTGAPADLPETEFRTILQAAPDILRDYFRPWETLVPTPMLGVVLALLGPHLRDLAKEYLRPHSFEWFVRQLPWRDPEATPQRVAHALIRARAAARALELVKAGFRVPTGKDVEVHNLWGQPMRVALDQEAPTLLAGALNYNWREGYEVVIPLRPVDPYSLQPERLAATLRATAEDLYSNLYNQGRVDLSTLWRELDRSDQLEIGIARRLILDHLPLYLRQLSVRNEPIEEQLTICDSRRRRIAEAEADGEVLEPARRELRSALEELADLVDGSPNEQQAVLQAVRNKLEQYQYEASSIPFELFQNADDAAIELSQLDTVAAEDRDIPQGGRRFVVEDREDRLRFVHWGRPINARGPVGFEGERRGYDRDLEKMLILSASDKPRDEGVTGKFGLGFKSVFLVCEQPRIVSGRLAIRAVAGVLPQPWTDTKDARQHLTALSESSRLPGTLVDLPEIHGQLRERVLERFRHLAGILCVFGRAIRTIETPKSKCYWEPREILSQVEVGVLDLQGDWGARTSAACVRTESGSLLMALGPRGFRPLPDTVPALWVTAPTTGKSLGVGFAINGDFDLDAGRGRLAGNTLNNLEKAKRIGREVGDALGTLLGRSREHWDSVRGALGLAADVDALDFWESIWFGLTARCLGPGSSDGADLVRSVIFGALAQLSKRPLAVANGLKEPLRRFTNADAVRYELCQVLLGDGVATKLSAWVRFTDRCSGHICVSKKIGNILRQADLGHPKTFGLPELVGLLESFRAEPVDAEMLGRLRLLTEEEPEWESDDLRAQLGRVRFLSEANTWVEAGDLLAFDGPGLDPDERRRHALAPLVCRLHADYYLENGESPAVSFFLVCRQRMEAPAEKLAQWVLDADSVEARTAALEYLAAGELADRVGERVRGQGWLSTVLYDDTLLRSLTAEQLDKLRRRLLLSIQIEQAVGGKPEEPIVSHVDLPTALEKIREWWTTEGHQQVEAYRSRLYPHALTLMPDPETGRICRSSWFMLLALGSFQGMGRTREEHHHGFIRHCQERGWWNIFTTTDPRQEPEKWMNIIEEYAEAQHDDEEWAQWLAQFPKLYRLRAWLDDYVELFLSIDRFQGRFALNTTLAPRSNPHFQGGGIDAPPLTRTLKVGSHLVIRELLHHRVLRTPFAIPHAYAPIARVRNFFGAFGTAVDTSEQIHQILTDHLGEDEATFSGDYDIPLRIVSVNGPLRDQLLGRRSQ